MNVIDLQNSRVKGVYNNMTAEVASRKQTWNTALNNKYDKCDKMWGGSHVPIKTDFRSAP